MGWVGIDSKFYKELKFVKRPFTRMEAAFCLTYDLNYNNNVSLKRYSRNWGWSRNKVRKFIKEIKSCEGSIMNGDKNKKGHPIRLYSNGSQAHKDTPLFLKGHPESTDIKASGGHKDTQVPKRTPETVYPQRFQHAAGHLL